MVENRALASIANALQSQDKEEVQCLMAVVNEMMAIQAVGKRHLTAFDAGNELILVSVQQAIEALNRLDRLAEEYRRSSKSADIVDNARQEIMLARRRVILGYCDALNRQHKNK